VFEDSGVCAARSGGPAGHDVQAGPGGVLEVWAVTDYPAAAACPDCGAVSGRVHERVLTRPRDVRRAADSVDLRWVKVRRKCGNQECPRKTFTEWVPQLPPRCRITARLREQAGAEVTERGITPAEAARHAGVSWPVVHDAFAAAADPLLDQPVALVAHLGIDEYRGRARFAADPQTGEYIVLADRWHTCFFDLSGQRGLLGQVQGRTADDAAYWLAGATPAGATPSGWPASTCAPSTPQRSAGCCRTRCSPWTCSTSSSSPSRRSATCGSGWSAPGTGRGRSADPEYGIKNLLVRNLEHLSPAQFAKIIHTLDRDRYGQEYPAGRTRSPPR